MNGSKCVAKHSLLLQWVENITVKFPKYLYHYNFETVILMEMRASPFNSIEQFWEKL